MLRTQRGFNLVESLVCLALGALALGVALPGMREFSQRQALTAEHNRLNAALHGARTLAITHHVSAVVCPSLDSSRCRSGTRWDEGWIVFGDTDGDAQRDDGEPLWHSDSATSAGLKVRSSAGRPRAQFRPNGMSRGSNLTQRLCDRDGAVVSALVINNAGRTRKAEPAELRALDRCE
jgi:type IV fimbrial biogenesis protein FimT